MYFIFNNFMTETHRCSVLGCSRQLTKNMFYESYEDALRKCCLCLNYSGRFHSTGWICNLIREERHIGGNITTLIWDNVKDLHLKVNDVEIAQLMNIVRAMLFNSHNMVV